MSNLQGHVAYDKLFNPIQGHKAAPHKELFISTGQDNSYELASIDLSSDEVIGERLLANGDIYVGSLHSGLPEGTGKYLWSDGCMYEGEWRNGRKSGRGKISWPSGATYEGDFMAGYIHGVGTFTGVDGTTYKGSWYMNEKKGFGTKSYANGDVYEGSWNQGVPEGTGRYLWKNGNEYVGEWKSGSMSGRGTLTWGCGDKYDGQWLDGLEHGHAVYTWVDGSTYAGTWSRGLKDGKGFFISPGRQRRLSNAQQDEGSGDDGTTSRTSERTRSSSGSDHEQWITRICRISSQGSSLDMLVSGGNSTLNQSLPPQDQKSCELISFDEWDETKVSRKQEGVSKESLLEEDNYVSTVVERDYVQGVLINELIKETPVSRLPKPLRSWQQRCSKEPIRPGETIFKGHQSYDLMLNLQLGIRYSVGKITSIPRRDISPSDFGLKARIWMNFPKEGSQLTPPHQSVDFKWKDYCPLVFRELREMFKLDTADYMLSICGDNGLRELSSPGKSGSVFYLSHDDRFMIKTMRKAEVKVLLGMLPNYYEHVKTYENTLITKFFGLHRIKPAGGLKVHFIVMGNMFCTELQIHRRFDLKGSSQGRCANKSEMDEHTTLKDLDLDFVFRLEPSWRIELLRQIEFDCKFLESEHIMDYSLLLGLHFRAPHFPAVFSSAKKAGSTISGETTATKGLVLVAHEPEKSLSSPGSHVRGNPLRTAAAADNGEVDLLLPGTARLRIQLGVNMPARADRKLCQEKDGLSREQDFPGESYDVVLYLGIIDILQEYDMTKKLEHAYKSLQFDALSISAVDPSLYSKRFQDFMHQVFPDTWG